MDVPDFMPVLSAGTHENPSEGACVMEMVSFLAGEPFSDAPLCTDPTLAAYARAINDSLTDEERPLLVPLIGRLLGTNEGNGIIIFGRAFGDVVDFRPAIRKFLLAAGADTLACIIESGSIAGPYLYSHAVSMRLELGEHRVALLSALIDEYDRVTGRTQHRQLTDADYRGLAALIK